MEAKMTTSWTRETLEAWAEDHFPDVSPLAENPIQELLIREIMIKGAGYRNRTANSANRTLKTIKNENRYTVYMLNRAKVNLVNSKVFWELKLRGGVQFTNEYCFATILRESIPFSLVNLCVGLINLDNSKAPDFEHHTKKAAFNESEKNLQAKFTSIHRSNGSMTVSAEIRI